MLVRQEEVGDRPTPTASTVSSSLITSLHLGRYLASIGGFMPFQLADGPRDMPGLPIERALGRLAKLAPGRRARNLRPGALNLVPTRD